MIAMLLRYVSKSRFRALIIRKTTKDLRDLINKCKSMYLAVYPTLKWKEIDKMFVFPSGATVEFNYFDKASDADQYQGQEFDFIGIDEITQYSSIEIYEKLKPCLRGGDMSIPKLFRATTNPNGIGRQWVKSRFVDKAPSGERWEECYTIRGKEYKTTFKWFQSNIFDNPALEEQGYAGDLAAIQNETLRRQWLDGDWDTSEGLAFDEFRASKHVVKPFDIPNNWTKFRACDWGYGSMAVCLWIAIDNDGNAYVYREHKTTGVRSDLFAQQVLEKEQDERVTYGVLDSSCWARRGDTAPSIAEEMMLQGCRWTPSDRSDGSRKAGKMMLHKYLQGTTVELEDGTVENTPHLFIFDTCRQIIKELGSLPLDPRDPEDVDTTAEDHAYDALRYGLSSRPVPRGDSFFESDTLTDFTFL